jgi:hypothetical protein
MTENLLVECEYCRDTGTVTLPCRTWYGGRGIGHRGGCDCEDCRTPAAVAHEPFRLDPPPGEPSRERTGDFPCRLCLAHSRSQVKPEATGETGTLTLTRDQVRDIGKRLKERGVLGRHRPVGADRAIPTDAEPLNESQWQERRDHIRRQRDELLAGAEVKA